MCVWCVCVCLFVCVCVCVYSAFLITSMQVRMRTHTFGIQGGEEKWEGAGNTKGKEDLSSKRVKEGERRERRDGGRGEGGRREGRGGRRCR